jgi:diketogulonate reductase-like aldo/keto reductase
MLPEGMECHATYRAREHALAYPMVRFAHAETIVNSALISCRCPISWTRTHIATLRRWKQEGRIRYLGITHYSASAYDALEAVMRKETLDFVQLNYSLGDRGAARKLLALAADRGIAVLVKLPFGGGGLLRRLGNRPLPDWPGEMGCSSWA